MCGGKFKEWERLNLLLDKILGTKYLCYFISENEKLKIDSWYFPGATNGRGLWGTGFLNVRNVRR